MRYFGCHVSVSGGLENGILNGEKLGVNTIQVHPSPPQKWNSKPYPNGTEDKFNEAREKSGIRAVFFHGIYLINLATPDPQKFHLAKTSLVNYLDLASRINADGVIFHVGSMKDQPDENTGYERAAYGINWILENSKNDARLLLEVAAGSGSVIGDKVEELHEIYKQVDNKSRVGFALDTQHMWASGYNFTEDLDAIIKNVDDVLSLDKVWAIHLNDSMTELGSKKDRHANLGEGKIGEETLRRFVHHPKLSRIPLILETPGLKSMDTAQSEVDKLKAILKTI